MREHRLSSKRAADDLVAKVEELHQENARLAAELASVRAQAMHLRTVAVVKP